MAERKPSRNVAGTAAAKSPSDLELETYDPVSKKNLAEGIVRRIGRHTVHQMPPEKPFPGSGVYLLYYIGNNKDYAALLPKAGRYTQPIYVGKADPPGTRKGSTAALDRAGGSAIYDRLRNHADRIRATKNLKVRDFRFRFVVLEHVWIRLGEAGLIDHYRPLWNALLDGFGSKIPGRRRKKQGRSAWDTLHPGKGWPEDLSEGKHKARELRQRIKEFLERRRS